MCVTWCTEVRSCLVQRIKSVCFHTDDVDTQSAVSAAGLVSLSS